jgi:hypothetical protein
VLEKVTRMDSAVAAALSATADDQGWPVRCPGLGL